MDRTDVTSTNIESHPIPGTLSWIQLDIVTTTMGNTTDYTYSVWRAADSAAGIAETFLPNLPSLPVAEKVASLLHREALCLSSHN